jgi:biotin transport system substrate-specific component
VKTRDLAYIALFAALTAVLGMLPAISVPAVPVPITAQTLGVMLAGAVLGARRGFLALLLFLVLVAVGLPLLAGGRGGLGVFASPSAGFLFAWPLGAAVTGLLTEVLWRRFNLAWALVATLAGGIGVVYAVGIPFISVFSTTPLGVAFTGSLVFVPGDLVKAVIAAVVAVGVRRAYPVIDRPRRAPAAP